MSTHNQSSTLAKTRRDRIRAYFLSFLVGIIWSIVASATHPFSLGADLVTGFALGVFVIFTIAQRVSTTDRGEGSSFDRPPVGSARLGPATWAMPTWAALVGLVIAFELFNYLQLPRSAHPTLSSFASFLAAHSTSRGLAFFGWLALGKRFAKP